MASSNIWSVPVDALQVPSCSNHSHAFCCLFRPAFRHAPLPTARAILSNLAATNLLMFNAITLLLSVILCGSQFPAFGPYCLPVALVAVLMLLVWVIFTPHPIKRFFYWRDVDWPISKETWCLATRLLREDLPHL